MKHVIVICTRNRNDAAIALVRSLEKLLTGTNASVLLVENSTSDVQYLELEEFASSATSNIPISVIRSKPGLATSRNQALNRIDAEFIHFLDDDLSLNDGYFERIEEFFAENSGAIGVAPFITVPMDSKTNLRKAIRFFLIQHLGLQGKLTKFGNAFWLTERKNQRVSWLPGCCMTYKFQGISCLRFSEELQNGPLGGYALGEDFDFSFRASKLGEIWGLGEISAMHNLSPNDRTNWKLMDEGIGRWMAYMCMKFPNELNSKFITIKLLVDGLIKAVRKIPPKRVKVDSGPLFLRLKSFRSEIKDPKLK